MIVSSRSLNIPLLSEEHAVCVNEGGIQNAVVIKFLYDRMAL